MLETSKLQLRATSSVNSRTTPSTRISAWNISIIRTRQYTVLFWAEENLKLNGAKSCEVIFTDLKRRRQHNDSPPISTFPYTVHPDVRSCVLTSDVNKLYDDDELLWPKVETVRTVKLSTCELLKTVLFLYRISYAGSNMKTMEQKCIIISYHSSLMKTISWNFTNLPIPSHPAPWRMFNRKLLCHVSVSNAIFVAYLML